jgi:D-amino-acid dehydrogenase
MPQFPNPQSDTDVVVIGAGIVGVSTAIAVQQLGLSVILLDRREPGQETSYGNAGILSSGSIMPVNGPAIWSGLPTYLGNQHPAMRWRRGWPLAHVNWGLRFLANATAAATRPRSQALHGLIQESLRVHRRWIPAAGVSHRLRETGWLKAWRHDGHAAAAAEHGFLQSYGIASAVLDRQDIAGLEPGIQPVYQVGLLHKDTASVDSPGAVVAAYARMFAAAGGAIRRGAAKTLTRTGADWRVTLDGPGRSPDLVAGHLVVALGPWSPELLHPLGYGVPMAFERGYHQEFKANADHRLMRPIHDADHGFVITPVETGVRITSGVEFAPRDAPSSFLQLRAAIPRAAEIAPLGEPVGEPWRGARPTLPDSLPMIGAAPRHPGVWLAFGHQHIGFSTGPGTGTAIAALIAGTPPPFNLKPFDPARYL